MPHSFANFEEFWPFYLREHSSLLNRRLHFIGTSLALALLGAAFATGAWIWAFAAPFAGYGFAWIGHFVVERNRPATFRHPWWSLRGDFRMWWRTVTGRRLI